MHEFYKECEFPNATQFQICNMYWIETRPYIVYIGVAYDSILRKQIIIYANESIDDTYQKVLNILLVRNACAYIYIYISFYILVNMIISFVNDLSYHLRIRHIFTSMLVSILILLLLDPPLLPPTLPIPRSESRNQIARLHSSICTCISSSERSRSPSSQTYCSEPKYTKPSTADSPFGPSFLRGQG